MSVAQMSHDEISLFVARSLKNKGYPIAFANVRSNVLWEQPDVIGFNSYCNSFLGEVKVSRADYLADKKKPFRHGGPEVGYGKSRAYITPKGLLSPDEIPYGWQLWEIHGIKRPMIKVIKGMVRREIKSENGGFPYHKQVYLHCDADELNHFKSNAGDFRTDLQLCLMVLKRMQKDGIDLNLYANAQHAFRDEIAKHKRATAGLTPPQQLTR